MSAPKMLEKPQPNFSADKMHTYILGKNLYQHVTGCDAEYFHDIDTQGHHIFRLDAS